MVWFKRVMKFFKDSINSKDVNDIDINDWLDGSEKFGVYLLTDNKAERVSKYLISNGVNIYSAGSNIDTVGNEFIMDINPSILLLIDTGRGLFVNVNSQKQLIDVIGAGDIKVNKAVIIFYTDSNVKIDAMRNMGNSESVKWIKYNNTVDVMNKLKCAHINTYKPDKIKFDTEYKYEITKRDDKEHLALSDNKLISVRNKMNKFRSLGEPTHNVVGDSRVIDENGMLKTFNIKY